MKSKTSKEKIWADKAASIEQSLKELDPDLGAIISNFVYEDIFSRDGLELKTKELLAIAHLMNLGANTELKTHIYGAINCGASLTEIKETIIHAAMFIGFPKSLAAMQIFKEISNKKSG